MAKKLFKFLQFSRAVYDNFMDRGCTNRAASLAFTSLLSIVPLMTVSFALLKAFPGFEGLGEKVQDLIFENFVADSAQIVQQHLEQFSHQAAHLSAAGLISLLITAVLMIFNMEQALNDIWQVKERRKGVPAFLMYWAVLTLLPMLVGVGIGFASYLTHIKFFMVAKEFPFVKFLINLLPFLCTFIAFSLLYASVPNRKIPLKIAMLSGFFAALLFEIAKRGFTLYITFFPTYSLLYGALAALPIFLIWIYLSWLIILVGAVIGRVSSDYYGYFKLEEKS